MPYINAKESAGVINLQGEHAATVTPTDVAGSKFNPSTLYIGVAGDVTIITVGGETVTYSSVPNGFFPVLCVQVKSTGTTATNINRQY